jgi:HEPN/Toprim N-terminal domain 1
MFGARFSWVGAVMGSYSELLVGPFAVDRWKKEIDPLTMTLFVPTDKHVERMSIEEWEESGGDAELWNPERGQVAYRCSCANMRDRLDLLGFTLGTAIEGYRHNCRTTVSRATASIWIGKRSSKRVLQIRD